MSRVSIASLDKAPVMALPPGFAGDTQTQGLFYQDADPLHLYLHRLVRDARLRVGPMEIDCMLYVWKGAVEAGGRSLAAGSSLIVEHGAALDIRGADENSLLLAFGAALAPAKQRAGGHVHLLPTECVPRVARMAGTQGTAGAMHANAECATCEVWLHENRLDPVELKPGDDTSEKGVHSHSEDEVIFVVDGQMLLGSRLCGPGTALAIAAETLYSFGVGPAGLTFVNFRAARPSEIRFKNGHKVDEVAFWRDRVPVPEYLDPLPGAIMRNSQQWLKSRATRRLLPAHGEVAAAKEAKMYKVIHLIKRKNHLTHEQFREHFERSHAAMALKFCGHLFSEYRRNYVHIVMGGGDSRQEGSGYGPMEWQWDLLSEWILPREENLHEIYRIMESPGIKELFKNDEDRFIDRRANVTMPCAVFDIGTVFSPKGTVFDTRSGEPSWEGYQQWKPSR